MFSSPATSLPSTISRSLRVGHEQQSERPAVLLVRDRGRGEQRREEEHQGQLEHGEHPVEDAAEPRQHPELADVCQPMIDCHAVHIRMNRKQANDARQR